MGNKEWDTFLNNLLGNYKPEGVQPNWEEFSNQLDTHQDLDQPAEDSSFDDNLKESFQTYQAPEEVAGWQKIQATLDAQDKQFDEDIRKRVKDFEPHYDPRTWPLFLQRLADSQFLGAKLIALKVAEMTAVLLILFTVLNMGRMGKLPFETPLYDNTSNEVTNNSGQEELTGMPTSNSLSANKNGSAVLPAEQGNASDGNKLLETGTNERNPNSGTNPSEPVFADNSSSFNFQENPQQQNILNSSEYTADNKSEELQLAKGAIEEISAIELMSPISQGQNEDIISLPANSILLASAEKNSNVDVAPFLSSAISPISHGERLVFFQIAFVKQHHKAHTEFGMLTQVDYNRLRMPEDRLYTTGRQIVFPQQGIPSYGYGGGFTLASAHPRWAIESGLIYSSKTFEPGRKLAIGTAFDNGVIEFEALRLQLVTLPVQFRYKVDNTGPLKFYTLAGLGLNLIVQSNTDVSIKYHFPSLSFGEDPNNDPDLANTIKETRRISEQIRDGAPFSTKSFLTATAGLGIEYSANESKTFFLQTAFQYQIPDLEFSNNNGKHIRSLSVQAGVRTPLGN